MYKVFFKESCFLLSDDHNLLKNAPLALIHRDFCETKLFVNNLLLRNDRFEAVLIHDDLENLFAVFKSCFLYVKAAGGVVLDSGHLAVIKRSGMYDLPKGHQEAGETIEKCALREVEEECGLQALQITAHLADTLHIYPRDSNWFLKKTCWYAMTCPAGQTPVPQTEEDIEEAFWMPVEEVGSILGQTYPSLRTVFELAGKL